MHVQNCYQYWASCWVSGVILKGRANSDSECVLVQTLSSLALVFALHHYKPTPLYVMDEINAALGKLPQYLQIDLWITIAYLASAFSSTVVLNQPRRLTLYFYMPILWTAYFIYILGCHFDEYFSWLQILKTCQSWVIISRREQKTPSLLSSG